MSPIETLDALKMDHRETESPRIDVASLRDALAGNQGPEYWQSLEQLAGTPEFQDYLDHEFPQGADDEMDPVTRRHFLKIMGASFALAGLGACVKQPDEKIIPYVKAPEEFIPGRPVFFATAHVRSGYATGVLVESHMGRPTKVEGNPDHPASVGGTDLFAQASVLGLYDPDRSKTVIDRGEISSWSSYLVALTRELDKQRPTQGAGIRILTESVTSPTLADQIRRLREIYPAARWHKYDPVGRDAAHVGTRMAIGRDADVVYHFDKADVVVSLDADLLGAMHGSVRYSRDLIRRRAVTSGATMNRLYVVESTPSITGAMADHRIPLRSSDVEGFARALAGKFGIAAGASQAADHTDSMVDAIATDLKAHRGRAVVVAGDTQPPFVHALAHRINSELGAVGTVAVYGPSAEAQPVDQNESLRALVAEMNAESVDMLIMLGGNPAYTAPADLKFVEALGKVPFRVHNSLYDDETSRLSHWHIPATHYLEMWSDARAYDGTVTILQPLIAPLYVGKSQHEMLGALTNESGKSGYELVREYWQSLMRTYGFANDFEPVWRNALNDGVLADGPHIPSRSVNAPMMNDDEVRFADTLAFIPADPDSVDVVTGDSTPRRPVPSTPSERPTADAGAGELEIVFRPDPTIWDGSYANNGWLQELPNPLTKLTWDNAAYISPTTAEHYALATGDVVELTYRGRSVNAPIMIMPGHADGSVTVTMGYGRTRAGRIATDLGYNAFALRTSDAPWFGHGLSLRKTGDSYHLATTQHHFTVDGRDLVRSGTIDELRTNPTLAPASAHVAERSTSMFPEYKYEGYAWGMAIDINACTGCTACVIACVAENNIPIVGKEQVLRGREMHWLRVDTYFKGGIDNPATVFQPIPCMQCEVAPCEVVCPVNATVHSHEGLNDMVYNRCIGTRYCSNNCPYKVRRFNFLHFTENISDTEALGKNPDVTVRSRGVMEKCTYCVQRINHARIDAKRENRRVNDGDIETACQAACPTGAIVFGDINDKLSRVSALKAEPRNYPLLPELNTKPRTTYLGRVRNPNPALERA